MRSSGWTNGSAALGRLARLVRIFAVGLRFGLFEFVPRLAGNPFLRVLSSNRQKARGVRLREALETLGPIFVKFGQVLSTRRDLLPVDIADELAKLQDQVPPFPSELALRQIELAFGRPASEVYESFEREAVASASIAQVHFAVLPGGIEAAVKILRPGMLPTIERALELLDSAAFLVERLWADGRRLKPREVVAEFAKHLAD